MSLQHYAKSREICEGISEGLNEGYVWVREWGNVLENVGSDTLANCDFLTGWGSICQFQNR